MSKLAGVTIDSWKVPIFKKHLDAAGYKYNKEKQFTATTVVIQVHYEWVHELQPILQAAAQECAEALAEREKKNG